MDDLQKGIDDLIFSFAALLHLKMPATPHLKDELSTAIRALQALKASEEKDFEKLTNQVRGVATSITHLWKKVFDGPVKTADLLVNMAMFKNFLKRTLLSDYCDEETTIFPAIEALVQSSLSDDDEETQLYQDRVVMVLQELTLNRYHVESKMKLASKDKSYQGEINSMIGACQWERLAGTLVRDRVLATKLLDLESLTNDEWKKICTGIEKIQRQYFVMLLDEGHFQLSREARQLTASQNSESFNGRYTD